MSEQRRYESQQDVTMSGTSGHAAPSPSPVPSISASAYGQQFAAPRPSPSPAPLTHHTSYGSHGSGSHSAMPQTPMYQSQGSYSQYNSASTPVAQHSNALASFAHAQYQSQTAPRPVVSASNSGHANVYNPPRAIEVYTLPDAGNNAIAPEIRSQFHTDAWGRILFYTTPPLTNNDPVPAEKQTLGHSLRYLADKARNKQSDAAKRKARELELEAKAIEASKRVKIEQEIERQAMIEINTQLIKKWSYNIDAGTDELYKELHGENWKEVREQDLARLALEQEKATLTKKENLKFETERTAGKELKITGRGL
jgi:chromatin structure-remodeling complex subunit RSC1/2